MMDRAPSRILSHLLPTLAILVVLNSSDLIGNGWARVNAEENNFVGFDTLSNVIKSTLRDVLSSTSSASTLDTAIWGLNTILTTVTDPLSTTANVLYLISSSPVAETMIDRGESSVKLDDLVQDVPAEISSRYRSACQDVGRVFLRMQEISYEIVIFSGPLQNLPEAKDALTPALQSTLTLFLNLHSIVHNMQDSQNVTSDTLDTFVPVIIASETVTENLEKDATKYLVQLSGTRAYKKKQTRSILIGVFVGTALLVIVVGIVIMYFRKRSRVRDEGFTQQTNAALNTTYTRA